MPRRSSLPRFGTLGLSQLLVLAALILTILVVSPAEFRP